MTSEHALTLLYDGGCPLCVREVDFLRRKDEQEVMQFVDINATDYCPESWSGITYRQAMARIHAIDADGKVLSGCVSSCLPLDWSWLDLCPHNMACRPSDR